MQSGIPCSSVVQILHWDKTLFNPAFTEVNELFYLSSVALNFSLPVSTTDMYGLWAHKVCGVFREMNT